jgi:16S rRNA (uracil1498-N3)-methyltransferase
MSNPVFLIDPAIELIAGSIIRLDGDEGRHAAVVRRITVSEVVDLCDGHGSRATGSVSTVGKDWLEVHLDEVTLEARPGLTITAVQALAKGDRAELAVEMLTEVGVDVVIPWRAEHSVVKWDNTAKALDKWRRTVREATKQARRAYVPEVADLQSTEQILEAIDQADLAVILHESATSPLAQVTVPQAGNVLIVIGPEGGISPLELQSFAQAGAHIVRMGASVMRTSTAGAVAVGVILSHTSGWN